MSKLDLATSGKPVTYVYVTDVDRGLAFYRDTLGLSVVEGSADPYGCFLDLPGGLLRLTKMGDHQPSPHPVLGFEVADIAGTVAGLRGRGVTMDMFEGFGQDADGVATMPDGMKLAFFKDADGNALTLSQPA
ncbi:catechol 2,3-dioxygenase-like lactoylglutathione lyase family enzyme [Caulobacter ginsengisoli]|uniref:Catechol 2,3-dioxygenase-like lactoylglutathione lyase family enzyme n=1 Tax=Caulobacter ginsengisoli TaxID=400775 RepID=A0ABU0IYQ0_9CAUL|nr:VOC family protein [Caulobacter ginsengisoli]MDQ0466303.1 catechol 2,3-dioxygenase-like lactoylglutathione lyase family enzyme [Caulobacter ginsengisoli]